MAKPAFVDEVVEALRVGDRQKFLATLLHVRLEGRGEPGDLFEPAFLIQFWNQRHPHLAIDEPHDH